MKRLITSLLSAAFLAAGVAWADPVEYIHPKKDILSGECTVTLDGVTYKSMNYPNTPPAYYGGYVKFTGENEGDPVSITFTEFDCLRGGEPIVFVYDGEDVVSADFTSYTQPAPEGYLAAITADCIGTEYTAESGVLCVLFAPGSASGSVSGPYVASVTAGTPKDMEFVSATASSAGADAWRGAYDVALMSLTLKMDGSLNPLTLDGLTFDCSELAGSGLVENVRVYSGFDFSDANLISGLAESATSIVVSDRVLKPNNVFTVVADVKPDASGSIPAVNVSALTIAGETRTVDVSALAPTNVANRILMENGSRHPVYTISDAAEFFDAGGSNGNIPEQSEGVITFVPAEVGQKIQIDFSTLELFNTNPDRNDLFRFYNGREVSESNLVTTLLKEAKVVKSSADDGSLTVSFKSTTGVTKAGWEAVVSQFVPSQMTLAGVETQNAVSATTTAYAGEADIPLLLFNVKTNNQLDPLAFSGITLNVADGATAGAISSVKIYDLGETSTFSTTKLYTSSTLTGNQASLAGEKALVEGDNWFAVAIDIAETALTGQIAGLNLAGVTIGSSDNVPTGELSASFTVNNTCVLTEGSHSHTMYGDWTFKSATANEYSSRYPGSTSDHVVTFIPTEAGAKAQIDFEKFDVYYSSSSYYGVKATFEVYSGTSMSAENLIWKLSDSSQAATGPGRKLRSASSDGAITVKFNPNDHSYTADGWSATVSQFVDHDAEVKHTDVSQASTAVLSPGMTNAELLSMNVYIEGTYNPLVLDAVDLQLKGLSAISKVYVLSADDNDLSNAVVWGAADVPADGDLVKVSRSADVAANPLVEENNYFFIAVDINAEVESDVAVDAKVVSLSFAGGKTVAVENGDPEGERLTKNIYILQSGDSQVVSVSRPILFYDEGGPDGPITLNFSGTVTFVPANEGEVLRINAEEFSIGYSAKMYVYSGREANDENKLGDNVYNTTGGPENLTSKADDGSITIKYVGPSYSYTDFEGFAISVTPVKAVTMDVVSIEVGDASDIDVVRGASDVALAHVTVNADGTSGKLLINGMDVDFNGSTDVADIRSAQVYYTASNSVFSPTNAVSEKVTQLTDGAASITFASPVEIDAAGAYHFWITADLSSSATPNNVATVALTGMATNGADVVIPEANSGSRTMVTGMGGTYRVGPSENAKYHSIASAVQALSLGVEDAVLFMLEDGEYKENVNIADVQGSSAEHPVIFSSLSGKRDNVVISGGSVLSEQGMIYVDNSSYIYFRNLTIAPNSDSYYAGIHFKNGSRHCTVENCVVRAGVLDLYSTGKISTVMTEPGSEPDTNCDYFTIKDSYVEGGNYSLNLKGSTNVSETNDIGLTVSGNTITKGYTCLVYLGDCEDFTVEGNTITSGNELKKGGRVMDFARAHGAFRVTGNKLTITKSDADFSGMYFRSGGVSDANAQSVISNNVIAMPSASTSYTYGVMLETSVTNILFAHNTISVEGASTLKSVYPLAFNGNAPDTGAPEIRNNILQNATASGPLRPWNNTHYANMTFSGNVYFCDAEVMDGDSNTLDQYREVTGDDTSVWAQASFFSDTDLHLREAGQEFAMPRLDAVATDADGKERPEQTTAGAYEFADVVVETPEIMEGYPVVGTVTDASASVTTRWTVGGTLYAVSAKADAEAPTKEALLNAVPTSIEADKEVPYTFNYLDQLTTYKAYFLVVSALGEESEIVVSPEFTTKETIEALMAEVYWDEEPVQAGSSVLLQADVEGGKEPYTYEWFNQMNEVVGSDDTFTEEADVNQTYRLRVTSADGQTVSAKAHVTVISDRLLTATFEDLPLEAESSWMYDPENDPDTYSDAFFSGSFRFGNFPFYYEGYGWIWSGYGYANETATEFVTLDNQSRNAVGGGADNTANYGFAYMYGADMTVAVSASESGLTVPGVYITNSAYTLNSIVNGDGYSDAFTDGDYMTLVITGYDGAGTETGSVDVSLADYRGDVPHVLTEWKWVDLSSLGSIGSLKISYESSKQATVPAYVCLDQLGAANPMSGIGAVADGNIRLSVVADGCLSILGVEGDYTLRIYTVDGVLRASSRQHGATTVSTAGLPTGTCLAEIVTDNGSRAVLRFVNK